MGHWFIEKLVTNLENLQSGMMDARFIARFATIRYQPRIKIESNLS